MVLLKDYCEPDYYEEGGHTYPLGASTYAFEKERAPNTYLLERLDAANTVPLAVVRAQYLYRCLHDDLEHPLGWGPKRVQINLEGEIVERVVRGTKEGGSWQAHILVDPVGQPTHVLRTLKRTSFDNVRASIAEIEQSQDLRGEVSFPSFLQGYERCRLDPNAEGGPAVFLDPREDIILARRGVYTCAPFAGMTLKEHSLRATRSDVDRYFLAAQIGYQLVNQLEVMQSLGLAHRDLQPGNICMPGREIHEEVTVPFSLVWIDGDHARKIGAPLEGDVIFVSPHARPENFEMTPEEAVCREDEDTYPAAGVVLHAFMPHPFEAHERKERDRQQEMGRAYRRQGFQLEPLVQDIVSRPGQYSSHFFGLHAGQIRALFEGIRRLACGSPLNSHFFDRAREAFGEAVLHAEELKNKGWVVAA